MTNPTEAPMANAIDDVKLLDRDALGRRVREAWVKWALTQPNPKPSWLVPYDDLAECDKEADRQIGEAIASPAPAIDDVKEWVLVPKEPTQAMIDAAYALPGPAAGAMLAAYYAVMLAAAPPAPSQHTGWSDEEGRAAIKLGEDAAFAYSKTGGGPIGVFLSGLTAYRAALSAASSIAPATGFTVLPLEWEAIDGRFEAISECGHYTVVKDSIAWRWTLMNGVGGFISKAYFGSSVEAQSACQAHFEAAIRSCISPAVSKESGEP